MFVSFATYNHKHIYTMKRLLFMFAIVAVAFISSCEEFDEWDDCYCGVITSAIYLFTYYR